MIGDDYLVQSLAWSLCGFLVGWLLGGLGRELIGAPMRVWSQRVIGLVVIVMAVITMITSVSVNLRLERVTQCQAQFNADYRQALAERVDAANQEREAQRILIVSITRGTDDQQALNGYLSALDAADANRRENPLPPHVNCP